MKSLTIFSWVAWGASMLLAGYYLFQAATERTSGPEVGQGFGVFVAGLLVVLLIGLGAALYWVGKHQSSWGVYVVAVVLGWPLFVLVARPVVLMLKERSFEQEKLRNGDFKDPRLQPLAKAVLADQAEELKRLLDGRPPPTGRDRAGNDLLSLAVFAMCERGVGIEPLRVLLDAGADPRQSRMPDGRPPITLLILSIYRAPQAREAIQLLLEHGADPDPPDAKSHDVPLRSAGSQPDVVRLLVEHGANMDRLDSYGLPPVVEFTSQKEWESAIYLVEKGARLDLADDSGVSLDYYLKEWKESIYGQQAEGWDRLRAAIAKRRASGK